MPPLSDLDPEIVVTVTDAVPVLLAYVDADLRYRFANRAYSDLLGLPLDQMIGHDVREILGTAGFERVRPFVEAVLRGEPVTYEMEMPYQTGSRYIHSHLSPDFSPDGTVRGFTAAITDLSARREIERARETVQQTLLRSAGELRHLVSHARCLFWYGDVTDVGDPCSFAWYTDVCDLAAAQEFMLLELLPGEKYTDAWYRCRLPEDQVITDRVSRLALLSDQEEYGTEFGCVSRTGELRWFSERVHVTLLPLDHNNHRRWRVVGVGLDVTEQRQATAERIRVEAALRDAQAAHLAAEQRSAQELRRFVREMLFSVTEGRLRLCESSESLPVPLEPFVSESGEEEILLIPSSLRDLRRQAARAGASVGLSETRIQDLVTAVCEAGSNAIKHGGGSGVAGVRIDAATGTTQVWVTDFGGGIAQENLHRATLEIGYSEAGTLGHGFWLMLRTCDRIYLLTGESGTTLVLEQERVPPEPPWMHRETPK